MYNLIQVKQFGGPEVLEFTQAKIPTCSPTDILIKQTFSGVNFIDIKMRRGDHIAAKTPYTPGFEATGIIEEVGSEVKGWSAGQRVAYGACPIPGSYQQYRVIDPDYVVRISDGIGDEPVAAGLLRYMTAHYLLKRAVIVRDRHVILIHAAAGNLGQLMTIWATEVGACVIGTVGSEEKKAIAKKAGCQFVVNYNDHDWPKQVMDFTKGLGVHIVYDSIGKDTFSSSVEVLTPCGIFISYGEASGPVPPLDRNTLGNKSLIFMQPSLFDYKRKQNKEDIIIASHQFFSALKSKGYAPKVHKIYNLQDAPKAHQDFESRKINGVVLLRL